MTYLWASSEILSLWSWLPASEGARCHSCCSVPGASEPVRTGRKHLRQTEAQWSFRHGHIPVPRLLSKHRGQDRKVFQPVCGCSMIKTSRCPFQGAPWKSPHHSGSSSGSNSKRQGKHLFSKTTIESNSKFCMHKEQRADAGAGTCRACTRTEQTYPATRAPTSTSPSYLVGWNL